MNFNTDLSLALEALSPAQFRRLARRKRRNRLADPVQPQVREPEPRQRQPEPQQQETPDLAKVVAGLPSQVRAEYEVLKKNIEWNLGQLVAKFPDLKQDVIRAMDVLFRGFTVYFGEAGESFELIQAAWLGVLRDIKKIEALIPSGGQYAPLRKNLRAFRDYLRSTVGARISRTPTGQTPKSF